MVEYLKEFINNNQFASGGLMMIIFGATLAYLKNLPRQVWNIILKRISIELTIQERHPSYDLLETWLLNKLNTKKCRRLIFKRIKQNKESDHQILPSYGSHLFWYGYCPVVFSRHKESNSNGPNSTVQDFFNVRIIFGTRKLINNILDEIWVVENESKYTETKIWVANINYWSVLTHRPIIKKYPVLKDNLFENLKNDINTFITSESKYNDLGIFFKRNYLFFGNPGNGKTSTALALAQSTRKNLAILDLSKGSGSIEGLICDLPINTILVLEDIDRVATLQKEDKSSKDELGKLFQTNLTTLLNLLDGLLTPHGLITIATTNHIENLDEALVRAGRFDMKIEISSPTDQQKREMCKRFNYNYNEEIAKANSMSSVQSIIFNKVIK